MSLFTFFCKNLTEKLKFSNRIVSITVLMLNDAVPIVIICVDLAVQDLQWEYKFLQLPYKNLTL